jgi:L-ascorbate metabolism protein UlaG (beta-lactamase superfamily)
VDLSATEMRAVDSPSAVSDYRCQGAVEMESSVEALKGWAMSHLHWFGQSAFRIRSESGRAVFIDPWRVPASAGPADLILVTHPHRDHYDRKAIKGLSKQGTIVVLPRSCAGEGQAGIGAGESLTVGAMRVSGVAAYNQTRRFHPKSSSWLGYLLEVDGIRVYHAGDTDVIAEMRELRPDIALLPIGGIFAMDWRAGVEAAGILKASLSIPMHYSWLLGGSSAGRRFAKRVGSRAMVMPRG